MPSANIIRETDIEETFRVSNVKSIFDIPLKDKSRHEWNVNIPVDDGKWNIGLIVGASGSGKTTIGKELFGTKAFHNGYEWHDKKSILDCFPDNMQTKEIVYLLNHVGFSSPPSWVKPFPILSNGEKFRVELARVLTDERDIIIIDEFTSVVDRTVAQIGSYAVSKAVRKRDKKIICLSCHKDIMEWLEPDWVYNTDSNEFERGRLRRPRIELQIFKVHRSAWELFKRHHYLTSKIINAAQCYCAFIHGTPVAFTSYIPQAGVTGMRREHRTVVLPDYQGVGLGNTITEFLGDMLISEGKRFVSVTSHPSFIATRLKNKKWVLRRKPSRTSNSKSIINKNHRRLTCSFEYKG